MLSPRGELSALSTRHNQPPRPSITPTSRKASPGVARRSFPRVGGRGVGAGKIEVDGVGPPECSPPARPQARSGRGRWLRRELALGGDVGRGRVAAVEDRGRRASTETGTGRDRKKRPGSRPGRLSIIYWLDDYSRTTRVTRRFAARPALVELSAIGLYSPYDVAFIRNSGTPNSMLR
jgi:hypothetical protein